jgi:hypothetical protein
MAAATWGVRGPRRLRRTFERSRWAARGEAEQKAARRLEVTPAVVAIVSCVLWDRSLTQERERRLSMTDEAEAPTLDIYSHLWPSDEDRTRSAVEAFLNPVSD